MKTKIVCLCGSSRFVDIMAVTAWLLERDEGKITMSLHLLPRWYPDVPAHHLAEAEGVAEQMDELHLRKIDLADEVFVIDWHGYIGESTTKEIEYATAQNKPIRYLGKESIYLDFVKRSLLLSHILEPTQQKEALEKFDGNDPIPILRLCAKTLENSNKWSNALAKQVASEIRLERANWLRRFATHLKKMRK